MLHPPQTSQANVMKHWWRFIDGYATLKNLFNLRHLWSNIYQKHRATPGKWTEKRGVTSIQLLLPNVAHINVASSLRLSLITFPKGWNRSYLVCAGGVCDIVHTPALSMTWLTGKTITIMMDTTFISTKSPETPQKFNLVSALVLITNTLPGNNILWMQANMTSRTRRSLLALIDILNISAPLQKMMIGIIFFLRETKSPPKSQENWSMISAVKLQHSRRRP